jgi:hypothetical protein
MTGKNKLLFDVTELIHRHVEFLHNMQLDAYLKSMHG